MVKQLTTLTEEGGDLKGGENKATYTHEMKLKVKNRSIERRQPQSSRKKRKQDEVSVLEDGGYKAEKQNG